MVSALTEKLYHAIMLDSWPDGMATLVEFGLDGWKGTNRQHCYEALYYPIRNGEISIEQLDGALGSGTKLTNLVSNCPSNPHKNIIFHTAYDDMTKEDE